MFPMYRKTFENWWNKSSEYLNNFVDFDDMESQCSRGLEDFVTSWYMTWDIGSNILFL